MPKSKYYKILGLPNNASENDVRKKYRRLAMRYHPDRNDAPEAEELFIAITEAYEILTGKKKMPVGRVSRAASKKANSPQNTSSQEFEQRAKEARARYKQQQFDEYVENEKYYQKLVNGVKWKTMRVSAILGIVLSILIVADYILPHHYTDDKIEQYSLNSQRGLGGERVSLVKTESDDYYWIERITFGLYGRDHNIYVESSWFYHNPIRLISKGKLEYTPYKVNFNFFRLGWLMVILFLIPAFTVFYKRRKVSFTVLYHFSYYGINILILLYLLTGDRWAHLLTLGFL